MQRLINLAEKRPYGIKLYLDGKRIPPDVWEYVYKNPMWAYELAKRNVRGINLKRAEDAVMLNPMYAYKFAADIDGANIERLRKACEKSKKVSYMFDKYIKNV